MTSRLLTSDALELYAPSYLVEELERHEKTILEKTHRTHAEYARILDAYREIIVFVDRSAFGPFLSDAPDPDDEEYLALASSLDCPVWSNDRELVAQDAVRIISTRELIALLSSGERF